MATAVLPRLVGRPRRPVAVPPTFWADPLRNRRLTVTATNPNSLALHDRALSFTVPAGVSVNTASLVAYAVTPLGTIDRLYDYVYTNNPAVAPNRFATWPVVLIGQTATVLVPGAWLPGAQRQMALYWSTTGLPLAPAVTYLARTGSTFSAVAILGATNDVYAVTITTANGSATVSYTQVAGDTTVALLATHIAAAISASGLAIASASSATLTIDPAPTALPVVSGTGFAAAQSLTIGTGATLETATISSVSGNLITLTAPLQYAHAAGEAVVRSGGSTTLASYVTGWTDTAFSVVTAGSTTTAANLVTQGLVARVSRIGPETGVFAGTGQYRLGYPLGVGSGALRPSWGRPATPVTLTTLGYKANGDGTTYGMASGALSSVTNNGPTLAIAGTLTGSTRAAGRDWDGTYTATHHNKLYRGRKSDDEPVRLIVAAGVNGNVYRLTMGGQTYSYTQAGVDDAAAIATALAALINAGTPAVAVASASSGVEFLTITPTNHLDPSFTVSNTGTTTPANLAAYAATATYIAGTGGNGTTTGDRYSLGIGNQVYTRRMVTGETAAQIATAMAALVNAGTSGVAVVVGAVLWLRPYTPLDMNFSAQTVTTGTTPQTTVANQTVLTFPTMRNALPKWAQLDHIQMTYTCLRSYAPQSTGITALNDSGASFAVLPLVSTANVFSGNTTESAANQNLPVFYKQPAGAVTKINASDDITAISLTSVLGMHGNVHGSGVKLISAVLAGMPSTVTLTAGTGGNGTTTGDIYAVVVNGTSYSLRMATGNTNSTLATNLAALVNADANRVAQATTTGGVLILTPVSLADSTFTVTNAGSTVPANLVVVKPELRWGASSTPQPALFMRGQTSNVPIPVGVTVAVDVWTCWGLTASPTTTGDNLLPDEVAALLEAAVLTPTVAVGAVESYSPSSDARSLNVASSRAIGALNYFRTNAVAVTGVTRGYSYGVNALTGQAKVADDDDGTYSLFSGAMFGLVLHYLRTHDPADIPIMEDLVAALLDEEAAKIASSVARWGGNGSFWSGGVGYWQAQPSRQSTGSGPGTYAVYSAEGGIAEAATNADLDPSAVSAGFSAPGGIIDYQWGQPRLRTSVDQLHLISVGMWAYLYLLRNESAVTGSSTLYGGTPIRTAALNLFSRMATFEATHYAAASRNAGNAYALAAGSAPPNANGIDDSHINVAQGTALPNPYWGTTFGPWEVSNTSGAQSDASANAAVDRTFGGFWAPNSTVAGIRRYLQGQAMDMLLLDASRHDVVSTSGPTVGLPIAYPEGWSWRAGLGANVNRYAAVRDLAAAPSNTGFSTDLHWLEISGTGSDHLGGRAAQRCIVLGLAALMDPTFNIPTEMSGTTILRSVNVVTALRGMLRVLTNYLTEPTTGAMRFAVAGAQGATSTYNPQYVDSAYTCYMLAALEVWHLVEQRLGGADPFSTYFNPNGLT